MRSCSGCGYLVPESWETCFKCGASLAPPAAAPPQPPTPPPTPTPSWAPPPPSQAWAPPGLQAPSAWYPPATAPGPREPSASRTVAVIAVVAAVVVVLLVGASIAVVMNHRHGTSSSGIDSSGIDASSAGDGSDPAPVNPTPTTVHVTIPASLAKQLGAPGSAAAIIDIHEAEQLVTSLIPIRDRAEIFGDRDTLHELETGAALAADISNCGCPSPGINAVRGGADGIAGAISLVPRQTSYPASFFSQVTLFAPGGGRYREFIVLTRPDVRHRWKIVFDTVNEITGPDTSEYPGAFDAGDFDVLPPNLRVPPAQLVTLLAQQWQHQKNSGAGVAGSPFGPDEGVIWAMHRQDTIGDNGLRGHFTFSVDPHDPVYEYGLDKGGAFVCGVVHVDVVWTAGPRGKPYQDINRENWGPTLAAGVYDRIVENRIMQPCVLLPAVSTSPAQVFPGDEAYVRTRGTRA